MLNIWQLIIIIIIIIIIIMICRNYNAKPQTRKYIEDYPNPTHNISDDGDYSLNNLSAHEKYDKKGIWKYLHDKNQYTCITNVPERLNFSKIHVHEESDVTDNLSIYGFDKSFGVYRWNEIKNTNIVFGEYNWVNMAPATFTYTYPEHKIPTTMTIVDMSISNSGRIYVVYHGRLEGSSSQLDIWPVAEVVEQYDEVPDGETVFINTCGGKLISYNTTNVSVCKYPVPYGIQGITTTNQRNYMGDTPRFQLTDISNISADQTTTDDQNILVIVGKTGFMDEAHIFIQTADDYARISSTKPGQSITQYSNRLGTHLAFYVIDDNLIRTHVSFSADRFKDQPAHKLNAYNILDYAIRYTNTNTMQLIMSIDTRDHSNDEVRLYWNSDCQDDILYQLPGKFNHETRVALGKSIYVYHTKSYIIRHRT